MLPRHLLICCLSMAAAACHKEPVADALFSKGLFPVVFAPADFALHPKSGMRMQSSKDCAPCHETAYRNWNLSRHKVALTNELYRESHEREPSPWCVNCHAPLRLSGNEKNPYREKEGVSCLVCPVRAGKVLVRQAPQSRDYA